MSRGAIKKIDELGRIVIPKDIRKSLSIKTNDSLEIGVVGNTISMEKNTSIKNYDEIVNYYANLFSRCNIKLLVTNREKIIYNNTNIAKLDIKNMINLSLIELIDMKNKYCESCDIRPIIIDSSPEGLVLITDSKNNEIVGELFNIIITNELDISC